MNKDHQIGVRFTSSQREQIERIAKYLSDKSGDSVSLSSAVRQLLHRAIERIEEEMKDEEKAKNQGSLF
jgi:nitrogen regulatory protein PII-like uncharacterized protein